MVDRTELRRSFFIICVVVCIVMVLAAMNRGPVVLWLALAAIAGALAIYLRPRERWYREDPLPRASIEAQSLPRSGRDRGLQWLGRGIIFVLVVPLALVVLFTVGWLILSLLGARA